MFLFLSVATTISSKTKQTKSLSLLCSTKQCGIYTVKIDNPRHFGRNGDEQSNHFLKRLYFKTTKTSATMKT